jgi:acetamidase/formamidase
MARHELNATPKTVHWGYWDASLPSVLTVQSGDEVVVHTLSAQPPPDTHLPDDRRRVPRELTEIMASVTPMFGPHILTGPILVESAEPGDVLQVDVLDVKLRQDWGRNLIAPLKGTLPEDFPDPWRMILDIDLERRVLRWPRGVEIPLCPFFGVLGVAPAPRYGRISSILPFEHGGNMDNKELIAGSTVYLPVWNRGALFSAGDGHATQGDGEADTTALETALTGTFRLTVRKDLTLQLPQAETRTHYITMGFDPDLDDAVKTALREMIRHLVAHHGLSREEAYALCSLAVDLRISQLVNVYKGAHAMLPKSIFTGRG